MRGTKSLKLPLLVFLFTIFLLTMVQVQVDNPLLLLERFMKGGGWFEIAIIGLYGGVVVYNMQDPSSTDFFGSHLLQPETFTC